MTIPKATESPLIGTNFDQHRLMGKKAKIKRIFHRLTCCDRYLNGLRRVLSWTTFRRTEASAFIVGDHPQLSEYAKSIPRIAGLAAEPKWKLAILSGDGIPTNQFCGGFRKFPL